MASLGDMRISSGVVAIAVLAACILLLFACTDAAGENPIGKTNPPTIAETVEVYGYTVTFSLTGVTQTDYVEWDFGDGTSYVQGVWVDPKESRNQRITHTYPIVTEDKTYVVNARQVLAYATPNPGGDPLTLTGEKVNRFTVVVKGYPVLTFNSDGGTLVDPVQGEAKSFTPTKPAEPMKKDMEFAGWYNGESEFAWGSEISEDTMLTAKWLQLFDVTFDGNGGDVPFSYKRVADGNSVSDLKDPTRQGYEFIEWVADGKRFTNSTPVTKNLNVKATWKEKYIVTYDANGGECSKSYDTVSEGGTVTPPQPNRGGYSFTGWVDQDGKEYPKGEAVEVRQDLRLTAMWEKARDGYVWVTFDPNGGTGDVHDQEVLKGAQRSVVELPAGITKEGYEPDGWAIGSEDGPAWSSSGTVDVDTTLVAKWKKIESMWVVVTFDPLDGTMSDSDRTKSVLKNHTIMG